VQAGEPPRPRGRPRKVPQPITPLPASAIDDRDGDPIESCPHVDRDNLLQPEHMHDNPKASDMQIGPADDDFFDSQEEDFYYDDYNDDDEEEREVWKDGEEVDLQVPPELRHAPDRRGKKQLRMQRRPCQRSDAKVYASTASQYASLPPSLLNSFHDYFVHRTKTATAHTEIAEYSQHTNAGAGYCEGVDNTDINDSIYGGWDYSAADREREAQGRRIQRRNGSMPGREGGNAGQVGAGGAKGDGAQVGEARSVATQARSRADGGTRWRLGTGWRPSPRQLSCSILNVPPGSIVKFPE
jgi:hypothetical protein